MSLHYLVKHEWRNKKALLSQRRPRDAPNIWVPWKVSRVLANAPGYFSRNFKRAFVPIDTKNVRTKFEVRSFIRSWDNRGYSKNLGSPSIRPPSIFSQLFKGLLFGWTLWIYLPNLKFVALSVPEIIEGTQKIWAVPRYAHAPFSLKFLKGFCSDGPCEYTCQIWSS